MEMEEPCHIMKQHQQTCPYNYTDSFSSESFKDHPNLVSVNQSIPLAINGDQDKKEDHKAAESNPFAPNYASLSSTFTISFGNPTSPQDIKPYQPYGGSKFNYPDVMTPKEETSLNEFLGSIELTRRVQTTRRNHRQAQEHVLSERKRREKLAQRFMSLSALLPGVKKMEKATVLEDASKYIIQLQTRVKELEGTISGKDIIHESNVSITRSKFYVNHGDHGASSHEMEDFPSSDTYDPEIKARISGRNILLRIYCGKNSSIVLKTLTEMERLHITNICCSILPFSNTANLVTITAQMSDQMIITRRYFVKCLQSALCNFR
ncbi:transcription factor bHLH25 [Lactuca sativa]|nr:transcription factor bHLH25 [Lactuca sativa]